MKSALLLMLSGAIVGAIVASFLVPPMLSWYTEPGGLPKGAAVQSVVQIPEVVRYVTSRLLWGQAVGAIVGSVLGLTLSFMGRKRGASQNKSS